jgi:HAD superfamily hydrolase (TIGR01509 family)
MASEPIGALIFDLDGLLVDSEPLAARAMVEFLNGFGLEVREEIQTQLLGRRLPEAVRICKEGYGLPGTLEELAGRYGEMRLRALRGSVRPMVGAVEIVAFGRERGLPMALATSGMREHANVSLEETGLAGLFDVEVTGGEVGRGKPAPDIFLLAAERLGVDPGVAVVFEDSALGVAAAVAARMRVVAVQGGRTSLHPFAIEPTATVPNLLDAITWLEQHL